MSERNQAKDALVWTIIYGGGTLAQIGVFAAAIALGVLDKNSAKYMSKHISRYSGGAKRSIWNNYLKTGKINFNV